MFSHIFELSNSMAKEKEKKKKKKQRTEMTISKDNEKSDSLIA